MDSRKTGRKWKSRKWECWQTAGRAGNRKNVLQSYLGAKGQKEVSAETVRHSPLLKSNMNIDRNGSGSDPRSQLQHLKAAKKGNKFSQSLETSDHPHLQPHCHLPAVTTDPVHRG